MTLQRTLSSFEIFQIAFRLAELRFTDRRRSSKVLALFSNSEIRFLSRLAVSDRKIDTRNFNIESLMYFLH